MKDRFDTFMKKNGWWVKPYGILKGKTDLGRDLLCYKNKQVHIVQAKNWSKNKTIHEKHIMQLAGTILHYIYNNNKKPQACSLQQLSFLQLQKISLRNLILNTDI